MTYAQSLRQWREAREAELKAPNGWLSVAGLYWLQDGGNRAGSDDSNPVRLPDGYPRQFGIFARDGDAVVFHPAKDVFTSPGGPSVALRSDAGGETPDVLRFRDLALTVIRRGGRLAIRMRDANSRMRREFKGLQWFPIRPEMRIEARWVAYDSPRTIAISHVLDYVEQQQTLGYAVFVLQGKEYTLEPIVEGHQLLYVFKDLTAGKQTYPAGRFLYSAMPVDGKVILDFNQAHNPPCAFTPYATCPLPPAQNRLAVRIEAGELIYKH
jgi:uncharacterized protein (DUF1684 family)